MTELKATFRPEFLNRVDDVVIFHSLTRKNMDRIVEIQLGHLRKLLAERDFRLELTDNARAFLANVGYDPAYGARPLKRAISKYGQNVLAKEILAGHFTPGDTILADAAGGSLTFQSVSSEAEEGKADDHGGPKYVH